MDTTTLLAELKSVDDLVLTGVIDQIKGAEWKARIIAEFESKQIPETKRKEMPGDLAHLPGRMIGGVVGILGNINSARCAGVAPEQIESDKSKSRKMPYQDLPDMYK